MARDRLGVGVAQLLQEALALELGGVLEVVDEGVLDDEARGAVEARVVVDAHGVGHGAVGVGLAHPVVGLDQAVLEVERGGAQLAQEVAPEGGALGVGEAVPGGGVGHQHLGAAAAAAVEVERHEHAGVPGLGAPVALHAAQGLVVLLGQEVGDAQLVEALLAVVGHLPVEHLLAEAEPAGTALGAAVARVERHGAAGGVGGRRDGQRGRQGGAHRERAPRPHRGPAVRRPAPPRHLSHRNPSPKVVSIHLGRSITVIGFTENQLIAYGSYSYAFCPRTLTLPKMPWRHGGGRSQTPPLSDNG